MIKPFWKTISPLFSNKTYSTSSRITILKKRASSVKNQKLLIPLILYAVTLSKIKNSKKKKKNDKLLCYTIGETDPTLRAIKKLQKSCKYFANKKIMLNIQKYLNK